MDIATKGITKITINDKNVIKIFAIIKKSILKLY